VAASFRFWRAIAEAALDRSIDDFVRARIFSALFADEAVALDTQAIHFSQHALQQLVRGLGRGAGPLKVMDFLPLRRIWRRMCSFRFGWRPVP
jgi:hypothetical protein